MDAGHVIVFVLMAGVTIFLVLIEINSRRNEARLKAESTGKPGASTNSSAGSRAQPQASRRVG